MKELKEFTIPFVGLKLGEHRFDFKINKAFFDYFEYEEFNDVDIKLDVILTKKNTMLEFALVFNGFVNVNCDITNELFNQTVNGDYHFVVNFGETFNNENEALIILPHGSYEINIQQFIYESIVLALPTRRVHPGIEDGTLESEILTKLEELRPKQINNLEEGEPTDPRWDELKKLLTDK